MDFMESWILKNRPRSRAPGTFGHLDADQARPKWPNVDVAAGLATFFENQKTYKFHCILDSEKSTQIAGARHFSPLGRRPGASQLAKSGWRRGYSTSSTDSTCPHGAPHTPREHLYATTRDAGLFTIVHRWCSPVRDLIIVHLVCTYHLIQAHS